ncbi:MAG: helix-turn-helix domain-containing protein [Verrucomicrobia bacterium]|nr:helix-turn-helix domain-containing protein [Verrucomicrobiota bacterium]MDA1065178.1 helix-turn-helix domain-containing protein [Verrucomicrobiota bacterium]
MKKKNIGSSLDGFLEDEGILEEATARAQKKALVFQLTEVMEETRMSKAELARRTRTSVSQINRLFDPNNDKVQLNTIQKAAHAMGKQVRLELV